MCSLRHALVTKMGREECNSLPQQRRLTWHDLLGCSADWVIQEWRDEKWLHLCFLGSAVGHLHRAAWPKSVNECLLAGIIICFVPISCCFHSCWKVIFGGSLHSAGFKSTSFSVSLIHESKPFKWSGWIGKLPSVIVYSKYELGWDEDFSQRAAFQGEGMMSQVGRTVPCLTSLNLPNSFAPKSLKDKLSMYHLLSMLGQVKWYILYLRWIEIMCFSVLWLLIISEFPTIDFFAWEVTRVLIGAFICSASVERYM